MFNSVQSLIHVWLFATPWTAERQASLPSQTPGVYSNSCPLSWWCHPATSSSVGPSLPALNLSQHQGLFHIRHLLHARHFTRSSMFLIIYSTLILTLLHLSYYLSIYLLVYPFNSSQSTVKPIYWVLNFGYYLFSKLEFLFYYFLRILVLC